MRRRSVAVVLGLIVALVLIGCGTPTQNAPPAKTPPAAQSAPAAPPAPAGQQAPAAQKAQPAQPAAAAPAPQPKAKPVKVTMAEASKSPMFSAADAVALAKGYFTDEGIEMEVLHMSGGSETMMILGTGDAHFAVMTAASIPALSQHPELQGIALKPNSVGYGHQILVQKDVAEKAGLKKGIAPKAAFERLKGRTFGVTSKSGGDLKTTLFLMDTLGLAGEKFFDWAYVGGTAARVAAFQSRAVEIVNLPSRIQSQPLVDAGAFVIADLKSIPPFDSMMNTVVLTTKKYLTANPDVVRRVVKALVRAHEFTFQNRDETVKILQAYLKEQKPANVAFAYDQDAIPLHPRDPKNGYRMSQAGWADLVKMAVAIGDVKQAVDAKEGIMWTNEYLPK